MRAAKKPNLGGRPPHEPTAQSRKTVESMTGFGIPQNDIGLVVGVSKVTLEKHYRAELDTGAIKANSTVAGSLYKQATSGNNVTAAIWWTKARMGWSETHKHAGPDGGPVQVEDTTKLKLAMLIGRALQEAAEIKASKE